MTPFSPRSFQTPEEIKEKRKIHDKLIRKACS